MIQKKTANCCGSKKKRDDEQVLAKFGEKRIIQNSFKVKFSSSIAYSQLESFLTQVQFFF